MSSEEDLGELIDCCRYGEFDEVKLILNLHSFDINGKHGVGGNTALHMACANGHADIVSELCARGALHICNFSGNYPLHWAIQGGHVECVKELCKYFPLPEQMDVSFKNEFGFSAISEAVKSQRPEIIKIVLEHPSADEDMRRHENSKNLEEKSDQSTSKDPDNSTNESVDNAMSTVVHKLFLHKNKELVLRVREIGFSRIQNPLGHNEDPKTDITGFNIWGSSIVMARWINDPTIQKILENSSILELGAGCGLPGISVAAFSKPKQVILTDLNESTVQNLRFNVELNQELYHSTTQVTVQTLDWDDSSTYPSSEVDVLIGCDLTYQMEAIAPMIEVTKKLLKIGGSFLLVCPTQNRLGLNELLDSLLHPRGAFKLVNSSLAPAEYMSNPLVEVEDTDTDDTNFYLHFSELVGVEYRLLHFSRYEEIKHDE